MSEQSWVTRMYDATAKFKDSLSYGEGRIQQKIVVLNISSVTEPFNVCIKHRKGTEFILQRHIYVGKCTCAYPIG